MRGPWAGFPAPSRQSNITGLLAEGCTPEPPALSFAIPLQPGERERERVVKAQVLKPQVWERNSPETTEQLDECSSGKKPDQGLWEVSGC